MKKVQKLKRDGSYHVRDAFTITVAEMTGAVDVSVRRSSVASFASLLVELFRESTIQMFLGLFQEIDVQGSENVPIQRCS